MEVELVQIMFIKGNRILEADDILWDDYIELYNDIDGDFIHSIAAKT